jgi:hypothetical protein
MKKKKIEETNEDKIPREAILRLEQRKMRVLINELHKLIKEEKDEKKK